ncbi:Cysteine desulfurase [gamma proteobacterium IMCC1989]|nr:Cysteine desulfurase [gamma proteobacterium IMCC1989]
MPLNPHQFKSQFPLFSQPENTSLVYVDNAATTQKPQCVIDAMSYFYTHQNGNAQRASHRLARASTDMVEKTRRLAADFLGASSEREVVFTAGATEAFNIIAYGLSAFCESGDEIVVSDSEHHANLLPWQRLAQQQQCELQFFKAENGVLDSEQLLAENGMSVINERTRILALSGASNVFGHMLDVTLLATIKKRFPRIIIVLDASQMACHIPLQASDWQCDFLVCSAHKFYGPTGVGLLYAREDYLQQMPPLHLGGEMVDKVELQRSDYVTGVQRFEAGTSSLAAIAGLHGCFQFWQKQDRPAMQAYERELTAYLHDQLSTVCAPSTGLKLITSPNYNVGIVTLVNVDGAFSLSDLAYWLDEHDIAVRVGNHCAQTLWQSVAKKQGADNGLRISLAAYNTMADVDKIIAAVSAFFSVDRTQHLSVVEDWSDIDWQALAEVKSWQKKYKLLINWGNRINHKPQIRQDKFLVEGCESAVWLQYKKENERHYFLIDSDSNIVKGLSALLLVWLNGKTTEEIELINIAERYQQLGLEKHLSPSRMNGFLALLKKAKELL